MIDAYANDDLKTRYISDLCTFKKLASYCLTEPGSGSQFVYLAFIVQNINNWANNRVHSHFLGSDAAALITTARRDGDYYIVNGSKAFISGSGSSSVYLVMLRHHGQPGPKGIFCLLMEPDMPGFILGKNERKLGWTTQVPNYPN